MEKSGPRKVMRAPALRRGREIVPLTERVKLDRVLGLTVTCNAALDSDPQTSIVAYPAGCVIILYNVRKNKQSHILSASKKTITSLAFSWDGKYLVTGECGHQPHVRVWDVQERNQAAEFSGHKYGINCVAFSPNLKYVVSVGTQHDMIVNVWEWKTNVKIASNKVSCKVKAVSFSSTGNYFVTVGNRHVKFWYLEYSRSTKYKLEPVPLMGRSAILGDQRNNYFCDVACGRGEMADSTYAITKSGLLCEFNSRRLLDKWVELRISSANCICVGEEYIFIGCSDGIVRCFSPFNLHFVCTLPRPHYLGVDIEKALSGRKLDIQPSGAKFPNVVAITLDEMNRKVTCVYNDHSMYVWDVKDVKKVGKLHSFLFHSACIWGVEAYPDVGNAKSVLPKGTFLTCSSDDTIRVWNLENSLSPETSYHRNIYSFELLKILYTDSDLAYLCDTDFSPCGSNDKVDTYDGKNGVRCLRISPDGQHLAAGDRSGNIRIYDVEHMEELCKIEAHDAEVLCLEYSKPFGEKRYLASASRDRLIHVFDVNQDYVLQQTLDDHSSSITAIRFVQQNNQLRMITCAADKSIIFRRAQFTPQLNFSREHHVVGKTTLYDMEVDSQERSVLTACQDRNIRVYSVNGGKYSRCFRGSQGEDGTLIKVVLDPSGKYISTSCTDKSLYIYDFYNEECLASMFGHSELVTGLKFTNCGRHLISVSGDGCIFVWKLPIELTQAILNRQSYLESSLPNMWNENNNNPKINIAVTKPIQIMEQSNEDKNFLTSPLKIPDGINKEVSPNYRFTMGPLPTWAKKQMLDEINAPTANSELSSQQTLQPRGRWAQRLDEGGLVVRSYLNCDSVIPFPNIQESSQLEENRVASVGSDDCFEISPESLAEINQNGFQEVSPNGHINMCRGSNGNVLQSNKDKQVITYAHHTDSSSASSLQLEDVEAEDERSDSEILGNEVVYYPQSDSPEVGDSSFSICASETLRVTRLKSSKGLSALPIINTTEQGETNSDDDEPGTPVDGDRTFNILNISTENLDRLGQREQFMKSNYESLEKNSSGSDDDDTEGKYGLLPRHSISAKFLARSLQSVRGRAETMNVTKSQPDLQNSTARREELNKALGEAKKKLETLGWRSGLNSSKSIGDLHNIPDKDLSQLSYFKSQVKNSSGNIRKTASLNDLSIASSSPLRQSFPISSHQINVPEKSSTPLWDQAKVKKTNEESKLVHTLKKKTKSLKPITPSSNQKILRSSSMSSLLPMAPIQRQPPSRLLPKGKTISPIVGQGMPPLVRTASSSSIISSSRIDSSKLSLSKTYQSNLEFKKLASDSSSSEHSPDELKQILPPPIALPTSREQSFSFSEFAKSKSNIRELRPHSASLISSSSSLRSKSEWDLSKLSHHSYAKRHSSGKVILEKLDSNRRQQSEHSTEVNNDRRSVKNYDLSFHCRSTDPSSVPLTRALCENVAEELKAVTSFAMEIFQRLTLDSELAPNDKSSMTTILAQGVWQAQQNLRPAVPPIPIWPSVPNSFPSSKPSLSVSSHSSDELNAERNLNESVTQHEQLNTMVLLQQYSDRLLSMVEERIGKNN